MLDQDNLEEFRDAEDYDRRDSSEAGVDVDAFYLALANEVGGPILDLTCGIGRVGILIAQHGLEVIGLDLVREMIAQARRKPGGFPARWIVGDARAFRLGERFRLVFMTGNAFQLLLTYRDRETMLRGVLDHLERGGLLAFETRNPRWRGSYKHDEHVAGAFFELETTFGEQETPGFTGQAGNAVRCFGTQVYDHPAQMLHLTSFRRWDDGAQIRERVRRIALRYTFPQELAALLERAGSQSSVSMEIGITHHSRRRAPRSLQYVEGL